MSYSASNISISSHWSTSICLYSTYNLDKNIRCPRVNFFPKIFNQQLNSACILFYLKPLRSSLAKKRLQNHKFRKELRPALKTFTNSVLDNAPEPPLSPGAYARADLSIWNVVLANDRQFSAPTLI